MAYPQCNAVPQLGCQLLAVVAQHHLSQMEVLLQAVKPGGRVVYSTCSISPLENDQVVSKALSGLQETQMQISISTKVHEMLQQSAAPCAEASKVLTPLTELLMQLKAEPTEHGMIVMPDKAGSGPMYVCLLLKS